MLHRKMWSLVWLFVLVAICFGGRALEAQDTTAKILGQVADSQGGLLPGATVTVTNTATNVTVTAMTDRQGSFQFAQLPIGTYTVRAERDGFAVTTSPSYVLQINQSQRVDFKLPLAGMTQAVEVTIQSAAIDTVSSTVGGSVTERPLVDLPLNGRNILDLARLQPGVTDATNPGNGSAGTVSVAGGRTDSVTYLLDGGNNSSLLNNGVVFSPNPDAVEEFRILENNYSAEYGRNGGGVITIVSKGGTSRYHGSAFEFARNPYLNANDFFNKRNGLPRSDLKRHQFGGTIGGEIFIPKILARKDRNFFFFSYEGQRQKNSQLPGVEQVFTTAELGGDFSHAGTDGGPDPAIAQLLIDNPYFQTDPLKQTQAIIDPTKIDPVAKKYIAASLIPSSASGTIAPVGALLSPFDQYNGRFDFELTPKDRLSVTLARNKAPVLSAFAGGSTLPAPTTASTIVHLANVGYIHTFTPNVLNEFRAVVQCLNSTNAIPVGTLPTPAQLGVGITPDQATGPTRLFDYSTSLTVGFSPNGPTTLINNTFDYSDNLSWQKGTHSVKFGGDFSPYQNNTLYDFYVDGEFDFYGLANYDPSDPAFATVGSATGYAQFLVGDPDEYFQFGSAPSNIRSKSTSVYAQDEWHATKNLTLNFGLRYEFASPKIDTKGRSFSLVTGAQSTRFTGAPKGLLFPGDQGAPKGSNFSDKNDFAPRFGFAYDFGGKGSTVLRGGTGMFYDILKGEDNLQFNGQAPFFGFTDFNLDYPMGLTTSGTGYYENPFTSAGVVNPFPSKAPAQNLDFGAAGFLPFGGGGVYFVDPHLRTPYTIQFNLGVQRALGAGVTAEMAYVGSVSHKYTGLVDSNPFVKGSGTQRVYDQANGGSGNFSYLDTFRNLTNENYHSLQSSLRKQATPMRYVGTTYFQLSYTFAKNMDNLSGFRQRNGEVPYYNPGQFYAVSDLDVKHRIVFSGGWDLPFAEAFSAVPKVFTKGWSLYPIVSWQSGFPLDVSANLARSRTTPGPSGAGDSQLVRVNLTGNKVTTLSPHTNTAADGGAQYITKANFNRNGLTNVAKVIPTTPTYGTLPRNSFRGPSRQNIDMSIAKLTQLTHGDHGVAFELKGDFFNLLNTPEFGNPITTITAANFGEITSTYTDSFRIIQLAGKLRF
ncbi:TonB-dependent receptor domain-containing protein [Granulicella arctica]|uniref:TonB-dependent receptor domain-containing protein n=1 Tax=Granulicella arctica TaxID=940613 RepID=UPI0021DF4F71|nr:TonB-dependent receptor [Granulicella arctica]